MDPKELKRHAMMLEMMEGKPFKKKKQIMSEDDLEKDEDGTDLALNEAKEMMEDPQGEAEETPEEELAEHHEEDDGMSSGAGHLFKGDGGGKHKAIHIMIALGLGKKKGLPHGGR